MEAVYLFTHSIMGACIVSIIVIVLTSKEKGFEEAEKKTVLTRLPRLPRYRLNIIYLSKLIAMMTSLLII
jgi:hypothetical protein